MGGALAIAFAKLDYRLENVVSRSLESAEQLAFNLNSAVKPSVFEIENLAGFKFSQIVFIAVPDPEIKSVAAKLAQLSPPPRTVFLHTSGALSSQALQSLQAVGGQIGSFHPLVSVSDARFGAEKFAGAYFCLEGDSEAVAISEKIVVDLAGNAFSIATEHKSLYHAAAVMSAGHLTALFDSAIQTLADCGIEETTAQKILLPLVRSTIENLAHQRPAAALTGTFARADLETMRKHLAALREKPALDIYVALGLHSLRLAVKNGANAEQILAMQEVLENL